MAVAKCTDREFIALFTKHGAKETGKILGVTERAVYERRRSMEKKFGEPLDAPGTAEARRSAGYIKRLALEIPNGVVIIGSDAHYWPGEGSTAHRGLLYLAKKLGPVAVILNGDVADHHDASRHDPIGWSSGPSIRDEHEVIQDRLDEIQKAAPKAKFYWTLGNHCMRFESNLAKKSPENAGVHGTKLSDHFPFWKFAWSIWINNDVVVKHRWKGGIHATHNNTVNAGKTFITGHLHSLKVTPFTDYNGTRFGVDTGTLNYIDGEHTDYDEDNPKNHRSGGVVLTFKDGKLLWPEIFNVVDKDVIQFRGELINV